MYRDILKPKNLSSLHLRGSTRLFPFTTVPNGNSSFVSRTIYQRQQEISYHSLNNIFYPHLRSDRVSSSLQRRCLFPLNYHRCSAARLQLRFSSSGGTTSKKRKKFDLMSKGNVRDPFLVLGISRSPTLTYASVKRTFLQIAMKYHPDTSKQSTEAEREKHKDLFVAARKAFEAIVAGPEGVAILKTEAADYVEKEEDFEEWFKTETGYDMPFMDAATMKEVADMTETVGGGLDRDGGMWTLARMVANTVKAGGDGRSVLQLEAGVIRDREINGILRRKRRR